MLWGVCFVLLFAVEVLGMGSTSRTSSLLNATNMSLPQVKWALPSVIENTQGKKYLAKHVMRDHVPDKLFSSFTAHTYRVADPLHHLSVFPPPEGCSTYSTPGETADFVGGCDVATNGGFFIPAGRNASLGCVGHIISNGHVVQRSSRQNVFFGIEKVHGAFQYAVGYASPDEVNRRHWLQLVSGVVWLVKDGVSFVTESLKYEDFSAETSGSGETFASLIAPRLAVGFDRSMALVIVAVDGSEPDWQGLSLYDFAKVLISLGVQNAVNLDGGGSVSVFEDGDLVNVPSDLCPNSSTFPRFRCPRAVGSVLCVHPYESLRTVTSSLQTRRRTWSPTVTETEPPVPKQTEGSPMSALARLAFFGGCTLTAAVAVFLLSLGYRSLYSSRRRAALPHVQYGEVDCDPVAADIDPSAAQ